MGVSFYFEPIIIYFGSSRPTKFDLPPLRRCSETCQLNRKRRIIIGHCHEAKPSIESSLIIINKIFNCSECARTDKSIAISRTGLIEVYG